MKNKYKKDGKLVIIELHHKILGNMCATIDEKYFDIINNFKTTWFIGYKNGRIDGVKTKVQQNRIRKVFWMHRVVTNCPSNMVVDHKDGNVLNNCIDNLRIVTTADNSTNLSSVSKNKSGYTNIYIESGKYRVRINGKSYGSYSTLDEAIDIRDKHIKDIFPLRER